MGQQPHIELRGVGKHFGGVRALRDVSLRVAPGTVHAIVGENGAGKSTLGKILAGVIQPDAGELLVQGRKVRYRTPRDALSDGITIIAQELMLEPKRSVVENVFLGIESRRYGFLDRRQIRRRFQELTERAGFGLPPSERVEALRVADQQKVEILRALARDASVIVMDEPTAALRSEEAQSLLRHVRRLRDRGTTVVFISHHLSETLLLADAVTVLRDGRLVRTGAATEETPESLVTAMLGRETDLVFPEKRFPAASTPVTCSVRGLGRDPVFRDVSFDIRSGEILGLSGLIGSGRSEVARALFGADRIDRGVVKIDGRTFAPSSPKDAIRVGIAMLPESRTEQGLLLNRSIVENVTLPHLEQLNRAGVIRQKAGEHRSAEVVRKVDVRTSGLRVPVANLSGGNQQKTLFAKWLFRQPRLLIADEPTRGVDVGAKMAIYQLIVSLAAEGLAVLLISSELEEIIGLAHRILVMREGRIVGQFDGRIATQDDVLRAAFRGTAEQAQRQE